MNTGSLIKRTLNALRSNGVAGRIWIRNSCKITIECCNVLYPSKRETRGAQHTLAHAVSFL